MRWSKTSSCLQYAVDDKAANDAYDAARHVKLWPGGHLPLQEASHAFKDGSHAQLSGVASL